MTIGGTAPPDLITVKTEDRLAWLTLNREDAANAFSRALVAAFRQAIDGLRAQPTLGTCSAAAATARVVITKDFATDPGWTTLKGLPLALGLVAAWSQPIVDRGGRVLGTFGTYFRERRRPTERERDAVEVLARTAAMTLSPQS